MSHIFDLEPEFLELYELCRGQTMTSIERMYALYTATRYVIDNAFPGDFVECGVNKGFLSSAIMEYLDWNSLDRGFYLLDTFAGLGTHGVTVRSLPTGQGLITRPPTLGR